ncbi:MAG: class I SAM-dependent methyltransferase [Verrucomicrobiota bacterium]|nr:class I SAM-dependent methyltransferase [Verrucomicrobiota bacterium]
MMTIARLNWPFYLSAVAVLLASLGGLLLLTALETRLICFVASAGAAYFLFVSLCVSHLVYDRSDLYQWSWLDRALRGATGHEFIFCHSGFDETSPELREKLGAAQWHVLDHFNETQMTEASIRRARRMFPPTRETLPAKYNEWPVKSGSADVVFALLVIHELRSEVQRIGWFIEAKRCLRNDGRVVLVEHVRDLANFLAFGPGFLHFHSRKSWQQAWEEAGFRSLDEFRVTRWVRVFRVMIDTHQLAADCDA